MLMVASIVALVVAFYMKITDDPGIVSDKWLFARVCVL